MSLQISSTCQSCQRALHGRISLRRVIDVFSSRVYQLETVIRSLGSDVPPPANEDDAAMLKQIEELLPSPAASLNFASQPTVDSPANEPTSAANNRDGIWDLPDLDIPESSPAGDFAQSTDHRAATVPNELFEFQAPLIEHDSTFPDADYPNLEMDPADWAWNLSAGDGLMSIPICGYYAGLRPTGFELECGENSQPWTPSAIIPEKEQSPQNSFEYSGSSSGDEDRDEIIEQLSSRFGDLQVVADGELRYYGATSNLTLTEDGIHSAYDSTVRGRLDAEQLKLERAGVGHLVDTELEDRLINLYFTWQDPSFHIIDQPVFDEDRRTCENAERESTFYSYALKNAMYVIKAMKSG